MPGRRQARVVWDLTALLNAADARASQAERHLWLVRLAEWLRHRRSLLGAADADTEPGSANPVLRLRHLLNVLEKNGEHRERVAAMLQAFLREVDCTSLLADFGFAPRMGFVSEMAERLRLACLPGTPNTADLGTLFHLLFTRAGDADWLEAIDDETLARVLALFGRSADTNAADRAATAAWRAPFLDAIAMLAAQIRSTGFASALRQRMDPEALAQRPFFQLGRAVDQVRDAAEAGDDAALLRAGQYLRALLDACRRAAGSVSAHLEEYGVSVDVVFQIDQLRRRTERVERLLALALSPGPSREVLPLLAHLVRVGHERRSLRALFASHYSLLARKVAERSAETGEHYITRDRQSYFRMLRRALGGGAVLAATTFVKFAVMAAGFSAFWAGLAAGVNYASSFVVIHLMHWTVATKQPAMTAPAMAAKLGDMARDESVVDFVDEVAHLIRSQVAGVVGNLVMVAPLVLLAQLGWRALFGAPLVGEASAQHVLHSLTLLGPSLLYAAFTGVLLFASSLVGGWVENWFVWHRLDSAIEWNPRIVSRLGAARARRWAHWWRGNVSGIAANVSLGLMLGLVPVIATFFGLPLDVRHVTLSTGQIAAAAGALGAPVLHMSEFWWCLAAIPLTAMLNVAVSFFLAFKLAMRSRGLKVADRRRVYDAVRARLRRRPLSFLWPPREGRVAPAAA